MKAFLIIALSLFLLSWVIPSHPQRHFAPMSAQMETAIHSYDEKYLFTRTAASYSPGEYMGTGVTSDGFGFVVTDAVGLFCNSTISSGSGTPNLIGTSTQMVLAVNNLHNGDWLDINGHVWFGGQQCGNPYITSTNVYEANLDSAGTDETFTTIANGWNANDGEEGYTIGVTTTGKLMICGDTRNGARGNGTAGADLQKWVQIPLATNIVPRKVYAGFAQFVICDTTTSGGTVIGQRIYSWSTTIGHASSLGYGSPSFGAGASSISTYNVPTEILIGGQHAHNILCIAGGLDCNYMLFDSAISGRADSVRLLGWGTYGWRMCHTTVAGGTDPLNTPTDITAKIMTPTVIAAASSHTIDTVVVDNGSSHILIGDGSIRVLVGWGSSEQGTLGNGMQLNFATTSTPYNDGGQDEYLGAVVQMTPVIICPTKANWKTLTSTMYYGYFNQYGDQNGNWFFCGRYKTYVAPLGVHSADFTTGNLSSVMNCGWIFSNFVQQYDAFANTAALSIGQGCSNACVSGPTSNSQCSAISVTCSAIHAGISVTSSSTTAYLTGASSTYAGTRLMHMKFYIDGANAPNIMDNPVTQTDTAKGLSVGSHTAKVVITGQYYEADSATFSFTISVSVITHFYCDSLAGNDANTGALGSPVQTMAGVNALTIAASDTVSFNAGYHYNGTLAISANHVLVNAYGTGSAPVLGYKIMPSFSGTPPNLTATCTGCTAATNIFTLDGVPQTVARTPNISTGYLSIVQSSSSTTTAFATAISSLPNIVGDSIVVHNTYWTDKSKITVKSASTLTFSPAVTAAGSGIFWLDGTPDTAGEYVYSGGVSGTLTVYGISGHVGAAAGVDYGMVITGSFCKVSGISVQYANKALVQITGQADTLVGDTLMYSGGDATLVNGQGFCMTGCYLNHIQNNGVNPASGATVTSWRITHNIFDHIGLLPGMGANSSAQSEAINAPGSGTVIRWNTFRNIGFNCVYTGGGDSIFVDSNYAHDYTLYKIDGGAFYWWRNATGSHPVGNYCRGNIAVNGGGPMSYNGTNVNNSSVSFGYYADSHSDGITFDGNISWHQLSGGGQNHGPNNTWTHNIFGDGGYCGFINYEFSGGPTITGTIFSNNTIYGDSTADAVIRLVTVNADITTMQTGAGNTYVHSALTTPFYTQSSTDAGTSRTLGSWQSTTTTDGTSGFQNLVCGLVANDSFTTKDLSFPFVGKSLDGKTVYRNKKLSQPALSGSVLQVVNKGQFWRYKKHP